MTDNTNNFKRFLEALDPIHQHQIDIDSIHGVVFKVSIMIERAAFTRVSRFYARIHLNGLEQRLLSVCDISMDEIEDQYRLPVHCAHNTDLQVQWMYLRYLLDDVPVNKIETLVKLQFGKNSSLVFAFIDAIYEMSNTATVGSKSRLYSLSKYRV